MTRYNDVVRNWTDDRKAKSNTERAKFHYLNPNGLYHRKKKMDETINHYVDADIIPSGWIIAYGGLNYYYTDKIADLAMKKKVNWIKLKTTLEGLENAIDKGYSRLGEFILSDEPAKKDNPRYAKEAA